MKLQKCGRGVSMRGPSIRVTEWGEVWSHHSMKVIHSGYRCHRGPRIELGWKPKWRSKIVPRGSCASAVHQTRSGLTPGICGSGERPYTLEICRSRPALSMRTSKRCDNALTKKEFAESKIRWKLWKLTDRPGFERVAGKMPWAGAWPASFRSMKYLQIQRSQHRCGVGGQGAQPSRSRFPLASISDTQCGRAPLRCGPGTAGKSVSTGALRGQHAVGDSSSGIEQASMGGVRYRLALFLDCGMS